MTPKEECEVLLDKLLSVTKYLLKKNGEFHPVGAVLTHDSAPAFTAVQSYNESPDPKSVIEDLIHAHRRLSEKVGILASGIAWNAAESTPDGGKSDAIVISLEHKDDYTAIVALPYKIGLFRKIKFGEMFAVKGNHDVF